MPNSHRNDSTDEKWYIKIEKALFMKSISPGSQNKQVSEPGPEFRHSVLLTINHYPGHEMAVPHPLRINCSELRTTSRGSLSGQMPQTGEDL